MIGRAPLRVKTVDGPQARMSERCGSASTPLSDLMRSKIFAVDRHVLGRVDAYADLITLDTKDGDGHFFADHDGLADASSENQH